jgi:hypothetical protein
MAEEASSQSGNTKQKMTQQVAREGYISARYEVLQNQMIPELSSEFAVACQIRDKQVKRKDNELYALVYDIKFPPPVDVVHALQKQEHNNLPYIVDAGKYEFEGQERYTVILNQPIGVPLTEVMAKNGGFDEDRIVEFILPPIVSALKSLKEEGLMYGALNAKNVYWDRASRQVSLGMFFSEYCGFSQSPIYEDIHRLQCHETAKGWVDFNSDYYALGVLIVHLLTAKEPLSGYSKQEVLRSRLMNGSLDVVTFNLVKNKGSIHYSARMQQLMKALLNDNLEARWTGVELTDWLDKKGLALPSQYKLHRETANAFVFEEEYYYGRKALAHALFKNWNKAKSTIKLPELSRWLRLSLKNKSASEAVDYMSKKAAESTLLTDERLAQVIMLIDPEGPIRYREFAVSIHGLGAFLSYGYFKNSRDMLQQVGNLFNEELVETWIGLQDNAGEFNYSSLGWTPSKIGRYIRMPGLGFSVERLIYDLNDSLPCLSPIVKGQFISRLSELLIALDGEAKQRMNESDPVDRHIAAFIAHKIDLLDEIRIKSIQRYPRFNDVPQIPMLALLTVAQAHARVKVLKGLCDWMRTRLGGISELIRSETIRDELNLELDRACKEGNMNRIYKVVSNVAFVARDVGGFTEAKKYYSLLNHEIVQLRKTSNIEKLAYQYGLRIAVLISYFVVSVSVIVALNSSF